MKDVKICGYFPGAIGKITETHAVYYHENWGFDLSFETQVGRELADFMCEFQPDCDGLWVATLQGEFAGSIAIDGHSTPNEGARLRWFIVVPQARGTGIGGALMDAAVEFCRRIGHSRIYLWTFQGLDAARRLYERHGFELCEEHRVDQWGQQINEQMFRLNLSQHA